MAAPAGRHPIPFESNLAALPAGHFHFNDSIVGTWILLQLVPEAVDVQFSAGASMEEEVEVGDSIDIGFGLHVSASPFLKSWGSPTFCPFSVTVITTLSAWAVHWA